MGSWCEKPVPSRSGSVFVGAARSQSHVIGLGHVSPWQKEDGAQGRCFDEEDDQGKHGDTPG